MTDLTKAVVDLLGTTDGRDKLMKGASAFMRVVGERSGAEHHKLLASSISEGRSLMRLVGVTNNVAKIRDLVASPKPTSADYMMIIRLIGDGVYSVNDNIAYIGKYLKWDAKTLSTTVYRSFVGMFWGFLFAVAIDIQALITMDRTASSFREKWRARVLMLLRNVCDLLAALSNVQYIKAFTLTPGQAGILGVISASVSTFENWSKAVESQSKKIGSPKQA